MADFAEKSDGGSFRAKCKKRIAHKVTPRGYAKQTPIGRPMPSKVHDWSKVVGRLTYPQSNVTSHTNSRGSNYHPSPDLALGIALARAFRHIEPIVQKSNRTRRELFCLMHLIAKGLITTVCSKVHTMCFSYAELNHSKKEHDSFLRKDETLFSD